MDSRIQKAMELEALKALATSAEASVKTLDVVLARLDQIDAALRDLAPAKAPTPTPTPTPTKGGR